MDQSLEAQAYNVAASLLTKLNYVGVLALEFFYGPNGLQVNEIAPRTHNSGHFSIEACSSSQFDQQLCIAADLPVPDPELIHSGALMVNLLGIAPDQGEPLEQRLEALQQRPNTHLHWYGKSPESPGASWAMSPSFSRESRLPHASVKPQAALDGIRAIWPLPRPQLD